VEHFEKALEMAKQCDGEQSERIATIEDNLGMQYALRHELIQSKTHFSSAYRIYEQTIGRDHIVTSEGSETSGFASSALLLPLDVVQ